MQHAAAAIDTAPRPAPPACVPDARLSALDAVIETVTARRDEFDGCRTCRAT